MSRFWILEPLHGNTIHSVDAGVAAAAHRTSHSPCRGVHSTHAGLSGIEQDSEGAHESDGAAAATSAAPSSEAPLAADGSEIVFETQEERENFFAPIGDLRGLRGRPDDFDDDFFPVELTSEPQHLLGDRRVTRAEKAAAKLATKGVDRKLKYHHIPVPAEVTVQALGSRLFFSGPLGANAIDLKTIDSVGGGAYKLERAEDGKVQEIVLAGPDKAVLGTARTLLHNKLNGVVKGYLVYLQLSGVGFRVSKEVKDVTYEVPS